MWGVVRAEKRVTLFTSNEGMDIIKIVESIKKSGLLIDASEKYDVLSKIKDKSITQTYLE